MPVVFLQAGQWNWFFLRLATAKRPQRSHTCTRYASLWSNSRSCTHSYRHRFHHIETLTPSAAGEMQLMLQGLGCINSERLQETSISHTNPAEPVQNTGGPSVQDTQGSAR